MLDVATRVELYLAHLDRLSGGAEPAFHPVDQQPGKTHKMTSIMYHGLPEPGMLTALTYGLSLANHPEWKLGRPELCISMRSEDERWGHAIGHLADALVHDCPIRYGDTIDFVEPIASDTTMTGFLVFAPAVMDRDDFLNVLDAPVGATADDVINIAGMFPVHESERLYIRSDGLDRFWQLDWDPFDPSRPAAV